jgi:hypothetical protein
VALVVPVVLGVPAVVLGFAGADPVDGGPFGALEFLPKFGAPADYLGDAVAEGHVANCSVGRLCGRSSDEGRKSESFDGDHVYGGCWGASGCCMVQWRLGPLYTQSFAIVSFLPVSDTDSETRICILILSSLLYAVRNFEMRSHKVGVLRPAFDEAKL